MTKAQQLENETKKLIAWSIEAFPVIKSALIHVYKNQHGSAYHFNDGSKGFIYRGSAQFIAY